MEGCPWGDGRRGGGGSLPAGCRMGDAENSRGAPRGGRTAAARSRTGERFRGGRGGVGCGGVRNDVTQLRRNGLPYVLTPPGGRTTRCWAVGPRTAGGGCGSFVCAHGESATQPARLVSRGTWSCSRRQCPRWTGTCGFPWCGRRHRFSSIPASADSPCAQKSRTRGRIDRHDVQEGTDYADRPLGLWATSDGRRATAREQEDADGRWAANIRPQPTSGETAGAEARAVHPFQAREHAIE